MYEFFNLSRTLTATLHQALILEVNIEYKKNLTEELLKI
jgi:hypothetical protein